MQNLTTRSKDSKQDSKFCEFAVFGKYNGLNCWNDIYIISYDIQGRATSKNENKLLLESTRNSGTL